MGPTRGAQEATRSCSSCGGHHWNSCGPLGMCHPHGDGEEGQEGPGVSRGTARQGVPEGPPAPQRSPPPTGGIQVTAASTTSATKSRGGQRVLLGLQVVSCHPSARRREGTRPCWGRRAQPGPQGAAAGRGPCPQGRCPQPMAEPPQPCRVGAPHQCHSTCRVSAGGVGPGGAPRMEPGSRHSLSPPSR